MRKIRFFIYNGIILTTTSLLLQSVGVSFNVYISNKIGSEAVGVYQLVMSVYIFINTLALSGINFACMRIVSEEIALGFFSNVAHVVKKCLLFCLFFSLLASTILIVFAQFISSYWLHSLISPTPLYIIAISLPFVSMSACITGYFSAVKRVGRLSIIQITEQFLRILIVYYLLNYVFPDGIDYACISLVLGTWISEIFSFITVLFLYKTDSKKYLYRALINENLNKKILKISLPISFTSYIKSGLSTLKQVLIPMRLEKYGLSCSESLSQYGTINGMVMPIILFPSTFITSFSSLLIPEFSYYNARKEDNNMNYVIIKVFKYTLIFSICIVGIFFSFSDDISTIFYKDISLSKYIKILCPLIVFIYLDNVVDCILKGIDKQVGVMIINIFDLLISISFIYFLLPIYGIFGYLCVIFISEIFNCFCSIFQLKKFNNFKFNFLDWIIKPIFSIFLINLFFNYIKLNINSIIVFIINILLFIIIYFILLFLFNCINKEDFKI